MESLTGRTKQAESWPRAVPAFISVGEFGRNERSRILSKKASSASAGETADLKPFSAFATCRATRRKSSPGVSTMFRSSSLTR